MKEKNKLEEQLKKLSQEVGQELFQRMKNMQEEQLDIDFSNMSKREVKAKVTRNAKKVEKDEEYRTLGRLAGKLDKARMLIGRGLGAYEPDEDFVEETKKIQEDNLIQELTEKLSEISTERISELNKRELEKLEEALKEFERRA